MDLQKVGAIVALVTVIFGAYQYYVSQKWKSSEFAAKQLELLTSDQALAFCCTVLDYSARRIPVPPGYAIFTDDKDFKHTPDQMVEAVRPEAAGDTFEWPLVLYRDSFDRLFAYLEEINHYITIGLFRVKDVRSLEYWLLQLASPRYVPHEKERAFIVFAQSYNYDGALELMRKFRISPDGPDATTEQ